MSALKGILHADGSLTDVSERLGPLSGDEVAVAAMPTGFGPWGYDFATQLAVPLASVSVPRAKAAKRAEIDARSEDLIAEGFSYDGRTFSLSLNAQAKWLGLYVGRSAITYPYPAQTLDGLGVYDVASAAVVEALYGTAMARVAAVLAGGADLVARVNAAATLDAVNAIVDSRT